MKIIEIQENKFIANTSGGNISLDLSITLILLPSHEDKDKIIFDSVHVIVCDKDQNF